MKNIKVLGSGCKKCTKTADLIEAVASELNQEVSVTKVTDPAQIMSYNVMSTPAVVLDESLVHTGSIPTQDQVKDWLDQ